MGSLVLAVAIILCARWFFRSDLADALAQAVRQRHGVVPDSALSERIEELSDQLDVEVRALRAEVLELSERVDFAERALVQSRQPARLPEATVAIEGRAAESAG